MSAAAQPTKRRITVIVGAGFSAALTGGPHPMIGNQPLPVLSNLTDSVLRHAKSLSKLQEASQFAEDTTLRSIAFLEQHTALPPEEHYSFEQLISILSIEALISKGSKSEALASLHGSNPQVLRYITFCLAHLFSTSLSYDGKYQANRNFWYRVNDQARALTFKDGLWHLVDGFDVTFVSFNYDGLVESFLDWRLEERHQTGGYRYVVEMSHALPITSPEFVYGPRDTRNFQVLPKLPLVLKPHGSIHFYRVDPGEAGAIKDRPTLAGLHPRLDIGFDPATDQRDIGDVRFWGHVDQVPVIVPPLLSKESFVQDGYFRDTLGQIVEAVHTSEAVLAIGFSLPPSDLHICAALEAVDWSKKKLGLVFRAGGTDETAKNWKRVAGKEATTILTTGMPTSSVSDIGAFWEMIREFLN